MRDTFDLMGGDYYDEEDNFNDRLPIDDQERLIDAHPRAAAPEGPQKTTLMDPIDESAPDAALCEVCYEHYPKDSFFALKCGHSFCYNCTVSHIEATVELRETQISCLQQGCASKFTLKNLRSLKIVDYVVTRFKQVN